MIHNLKYFLLASLLLSIIVVSSNAQELRLERQVIGTAGVHAIENNQGMKLSGISGQLAITMLEGKGGVTEKKWNNFQGFWVPDTTKVNPSVDEGPLVMREELTNYPNPVSDQTTIQYSLEYGGYVELKVYDLSGRVIATLAQGYQGAGDQNVTWNLQDASGTRLPSGSYMYELRVSPSNSAGGSGLYDAYNLRNIMVVVE